MATKNSTFGVWNNLDEIALFLGIERLTGESDEEFFNRAKLVGKYKYRTDYYTQVHSIPLQAGLKTYNLFNIYHKDSKAFKCEINWEYFILEGETDYIRIFINNEEATVDKIIEAINKTTEFGITFNKNMHKSTKCKYLIRNTNVTTEIEYIASKRTHLKNKSLIDGTFISSDTNHMCSNEVSDIASLKYSGDYYIDKTNGYLELYDVEPEEFFITYQCTDSIFTVESTELNLIPMNLFWKYGISNKCIDLATYLLNGKTFGA